MEKTNEGFGQKINKIVKAIRRRRRIRRRNALKAGKLTFSMKLKKAFRKISGLFMGLKPWTRAAACAMLALLILVPTVIAFVPSKPAVADAETGDLQKSNGSVIDIGAQSAANSTPYKIQQSDIKATPLPSPTPTPILFTKGERGDIIPDVQLRLMGLSYMDSDEPTDLFGATTSGAISVFQRKNDLPITGDLDRQTYDLLMSDAARPYVVEEGDTGDDIAELQDRLYQLGYIDLVTGYFGSDTTKAVKLFQEKNKLTQTGRIDGDTREMLYSENAKSHYISFGAEGEEVKQFQEILQRLGYLTTTPDGKSGNDTVAAIKRFQEKNGLIADGNLGPATRKLLLSDKAQANALTVGMSGVDVENVQKLLKKHGYLKDKNCTGYYGSVTEYAVKAFQKRNGLSVDGRVGRQTMTALKKSEAKGPASGYVIGGGGSGGNSDKSGIERLVDAAKSRLGCKYVLGKKGPNQFDCSGLVYWCLNKAGVKQGYMTSIAWRSCSKYQRINSFSDIKRGDIIVFKMSASQGHVGIAISSSVMIDASNRNGKVVERSFKTSYWKGVFYCAYRIF